MVMTSYLTAYAIAIAMLLLLILSGWVLLPKALRQSTRRPHDG